MVKDEAIEVCFESELCVGQPTWSVATCLALSDKARYGIEAITTVESEIRQVISFHSSVSQQAKSEADHLLFMWILKKLLLSLGLFSLQLRSKPIILDLKLGLFIKKMVQSDSDAEGQTIYPCLPARKLRICSAGDGDMKDRLNMHKGVEPTLESAYEFL